MEGSGEAQEAQPASPALGRRSQGVSCFVGDQMQFLGPGGLSKFSAVTLELLIFAVHGPKFISVAEASPLLGEWQWMHTNTGH